MLRSFFCSALLLLFLSLFESAVLANIQVLTVIPDLILITVIYLAYKNGSFFGESCGFFSGLIIDVLSAAPIGLNACIRTVTGFVYGLLRTSVAIDRFLFPLLLCFSGTFLKLFITFILSLFYRNGVFVASLFSSRILIEAVMNGLLGSVLFLIYDCFPGILTVKDSGDR